MLRLSASCVEIGTSHCNPYTFSDMSLITIKTDKTTPDKAATTLCSGDEANISTVLTSFFQVVICLHLEKLYLMTLVVFCE